MSPVTEEQVCFQRIADHMGLAHGDVVEKLMDDMRTEVPVRDFGRIWRKIRSWENVTLVLPTEAGSRILEGRLPLGRFQGATFVFRHEPSGLSASLDVAEIASLWLVSGPFYRLDNCSIQAFDREGEPLLFIYVGRDEQNRLLEPVKESFNALRSCYQ